MLNQLTTKFFRSLAWLDAKFFDRNRIDKEIPRPKFFNHIHGTDWIIENYDKPKMRILEIGSRELTKKSVLREKLRFATYLGIDIYAGKNVDVVGDVHCLSTLIENNSIDLIYSSSTFEHLAMPWIVAEEITKVLRLNGVVCIETCFSYRAHERPWNFFQFSDAGLKVLFNKKLGYECLDAGLDLPMVARFNLVNPKYLRFKEVGSMFSHSYFVGKLRNKCNFPFDWRSIQLDDYMPNTIYPYRNDL